MTSFYRWGPNLVCYSRPKVYTCTPNFVWMCSLCRLLVAKNHNFWQILSFGVLLYRPLLPMRAKFGVLQQTQGVRLRAKFRLDQFILSPSVGEKLQFLPFFGLRHLVVSPVGSSLRKLDTGAQLQTFPYPTVSKLFLYSNDFMAKSGAQSLTFKRVTDKQTNRQTNKKTQRFWLPQRRVNSVSHQTWHGDRGPRARSCTSRTFPGMTHTFAARGLKIWVEPDPLILKPPNSLTPWPNPSKF